MPPTFRDLTTLRVGGPASRFELAETSEQLIQLVREATDPLLVVGGGSNLLVGEQGWDGLVVKVASTGLCIDGERVRVQAGHVWDDVVAQSLAAGLAGLETLSGIPGSAGGTPVQNVGAYGTLTSDLLTGLHVYDRHTDRLESWTPEQCEFGSHRWSIFKQSDRYVVVDLTFGLRRSQLSGPIRYAGLATYLGCELGACLPARTVRAAVLDLRRQRGMVLDADDHDTWSVGSFFLNPVLGAVPAAAKDCPSFADPLGAKLSAAWLIEQSGFARGYGREWGRGTVTLSSRHTLAITNRGGASSSDVTGFARHVRDGVEQRFGIRLQPECNLINCAV